MKKLESSLMNMVIVLTAVAVVAGLLLGYINQATSAPIAEANEKALNDALAAVMPQGYDNQPLTDSSTVKVNDISYKIYKATQNGKFIGAAVETSANGFGGELTLLVGFDKDGNIHNYSVLKHSETPGLGSKAGEWFKPQAKTRSMVEKVFGFEVSSEPKKSNILGMNPGTEPLTVTKDGGNVDAITASTITSRAFLKAVNNAYAAYAAQNGQQVDTDAHSGASIKIKPEDLKQN